MDFFGPDQFALKQYEFLLKELARYDNGTRIISWLSVVAGVFVACIRFGSLPPEVHLLVPLMCLVVVQTVSSNNFAFRCRKNFIIHFEEQFRQRLPPGTFLLPDFYSRFVPLYYNYDRKPMRRMLPFQVLVFLCLLFNSLVGGYSTYISVKYLASKVGLWAAVAYALLAGALIVYVVLSWIWGSRYVKQ